MAPPSVSVSAPSAGQAIIGVAAVTAGIAAASAVKPDNLIDWAFAKLSHLAVSLSYGPPREGQSRSWWQRGVDGISKLVDETALQLQLKQKQMEFDDASPIKSTMLVRACIGLGAMMITKSLMYRVTTNTR